MALTTGLLSWYKLDSDSTDSAGSSDGTDTGITYSTGKIGNAAYFDNTDRITATLSQAPSASGAFTIAGWIYLADTSAMYHGFGLRDFNLFEYPSFEIRVHSGNNLQWIISKGGTNFKYYLKSTVGASAWIHVAFTTNGSTLKAYFNGADESASFTTAGSGAVTSDLTSALVKLGSSEASSFRGRMDMVGFWSRALSAAEVAELYNSGLGLDYPFTTGTGLQVNIGDAWKSVDAMQINIGDAWKSVAGAQINIGDAWKTIF